MSELTELASADAYCRALARRHYENFTVASRVLPPELRLHLARVYAYCRTTDDLGDESGAQALARLARWREEVERCLQGEAPIHPVLIALRQTVDTFQMPAQPFLDLIAANVQDQEVTTYESWEDLNGYCRLSAAPVGRMVLRVFGVDDPRAEELSDDVCIGLQLANFAQDVRRDGERGRTYLLQSDVRDVGLEGAVRALCGRAATLLSSGEALETLVPVRLGVQLTLYRLGGLAVLAAIEGIGYRTDRERPRVSTLGKARIVSAALVSQGRSRRDARAQRTASTRSARP